MLVELLPPRLLCATGMDPHFGTNGTATFSNERQTFTGDAFLAAGGAIYLEMKVTGQTAIYKYTAAGQPDAAWGKNGTVALDFDVDHLALDTHSGNLYATHVDQGELDVLRLTPRGQPDATYGNAGIATYQAPLQHGVNAGILVESLLPLAHGKLLIAVRRQNATLHVKPQFGTRVGTQTEDVALMRLRNNGTRDPKFGQQGVVTVLGGAATVRTDGTLNQASNEGTVVDIADVKPRSDGGYAVALTRTVGRRAGDYSRSSGDVMIKTRVVSESGSIHADTAASWALPLPFEGASVITPFYVGLNDDSTVTVLDYDRISRFHPATFAYTLTPGKRAVPKQIDVGVISPTNAVRGSDGSLYVYNQNGRRVLKLSPMLQRDKAFGNHGIATPDKPGWFVPDDQRALVIIGGWTMQRFA